MKISNELGLFRLDSYIKNKRLEEKRLKDALRSMGQDGEKVILSEGVKGIAYAMDSLSRIPEIRHEKVEALKQAIDTQAYEVDPNEVSKKMLAESVLTAGILKD